MAIRRVHRKIDRTPEQLEELRAVRDAFQAEKPSLDELVASGEYEVVGPAAGDRHLELVRAFPLRPIRSEEELDRAIAMANTLIDRDELTPDEDDYLDILGDIVRKYEKEHHPQPTVATKTYSFSLLIADVDEMTVEMADALFEAGCDDGSPRSCEGVVSVAFDREAESLGDAIGSAVKDVERAGYAVARVDIGQELAMDKETRKAIEPPGAG